MIQTAAWIALAPRKNWRDGSSGSAATARRRTCEFSPDPTNRDKSQRKREGGADSSVGVAINTAGGAAAGGCWRLDARERRAGRCVIATAEQSGSFRLI